MMHKLIGWLRRAAVKQCSRDSAFVMRDASVDGRGVQPAFRSASWDQIRDGQGLQRDPIDEYRGRPFSS